MLGRIQTFIWLLPPVAGYSMSELSTKPYLIRAIYEWCSDSGLTPHIAVKVNAGTRVPMAFVKNGEIVLNISFGATHALNLDNDSVSFSARFSGVSRDIFIPIECIVAIYANETGQGMAFEAAQSPFTDPAIDAPESSPESIQAATKAAEAAAVAAMSNNGAPSLASVTSIQGQAHTNNPETDPEPPKKGGRPTLTRIK